MFGRIFGRGKDDQDQAVCAECGRTLLAGEWTQKVVDEHGEERLICSLCGQAYAGAQRARGRRARTGQQRAHARDAQRGALRGAPGAGARAEPPARDTHAESDAFWQALKDKDAQIETPQGASWRARRPSGRSSPAASRAWRSRRATEPEPGSLTGDSSEPGERTWGETPAEFAAEMAALREAEAAPAQPQAVCRTTGPSRPTRAGRGRRRAAEAAVVEAVVVDEAVAGEPPRPSPSTRRTSPADRRRAAGRLADRVRGHAAHRRRSPTRCSPPRRTRTRAPARSPRPTPRRPWPPAAAHCPASRRPRSRAAPSAAEAEAAAASLTLLQRGVDLLNVSRVPRKIAETNEQLGLPHVHVGFDGETVAVTFMWSMGWYRFHVDLDSGDVTHGRPRLRGAHDCSPTPACAPTARCSSRRRRSAAPPPQRAQAAPEAAPPRLSRRPPRRPARPPSPRRRARRRRSRRSSSASRCSASAATTRARPGRRPRRATSTGTAERPTSRRGRRLTRKGRGRLTAAPALFVWRPGGASRAAAQTAQNVIRCRPACRRTAGS